MTTLAPHAVWRPVHACTARRVAPELGAVMHCQQGNNSPHDWFDRKGSKSSSTWWIAKDGRLEQYVDLATSYAWAQGSGNGMYHSIEFEGWVTEPLTEAQLDTAAALYAWGADTRGWAMKLAEAPGQTGFGWHGMGAKSGWGHPDCPGDIRRPQRAVILARAARILHPTAPTPDTKKAEADDMTPDQERKLDDLLKIGKVIVRQLGGDYDKGNWPGWPQLGNQTIVDALAEVLLIAGQLPDETVTTLLSHEVTVRDPRTASADRIQLETALTRASEGAEARQLLDGTIRPGVVKPVR
jgi:hypothetical protein